MKILTLPPLIIKKTTDRRTMQNDIGDRNNQKQNLCPISSQSYAIKPRCRLVMSPRMLLSLCGFLYNFFFIKKILSWFILCLLRPLLDGGNRYLLSLSLRFRLTRGIYLWRKEKGITSFDLKCTIMLVSRSDFPLIPVLFAVTLALWQWLSECRLLSDECCERASQGKGKIRNVNTISF